MVDELVVVLCSVQNLIIILFPRPYLNVACNVDIMTYRSHQRTLRNIP